MTNTQLYLAIGVPVLVNAAMITLAFTLLMIHMNTRFEDLKEIYGALSCIAWKKCWTPG